MSCLMLHCFECLDKVKKKCLCGIPVICTKLQLGRPHAERFNSTAQCRAQDRMSPLMTLYNHISIRVKVRLFFMHSRIQLDFNSRSDESMFSCNNELNFFPSSVFSVVLIKLTLPSSSSSSFSSSWTRHKDSLRLRDVKEQEKDRTVRKYSMWSCVREHFCERFRRKKLKKSLSLPLGQGDSVRRTLMLTVDVSVSVSRGLPRSDHGGPDEKGRQQPRPHHLRRLR